MRLLVTLTLSCLLAGTTVVGAAPPEEVAIGQLLRDATMRGLNSPARDARASTLPITVLVDAEGRVLGKVHGAREWDSPAALDFIHETFGHRSLGRPPSSAAPTSTR